MTLAGSVFTWPGMPARKWIEAVIYHDSIRILPPEDQDRAYDLLFEEKIKPKDIYEHTVAAASGREVYVTERLVSMMLHDSVRGQVMLHADLDRIPFGAVLDIVYAVSTQWADEKKRKEFDEWLYAPVALGPDEGRRQARQMREAARAAGQPVASGRPSSWTPPKTGRRHWHRRRDS